MVKRCPKCKLYLSTRRFHRGQGRCIGCRKSAQTTSRQQRRLDWVAYDSHRYAMKVATPELREKERARKREWKRNNREKANENWWRYHTRKLDAFVEDVKLSVLWQRDEGICGICNGPILEGEDCHIDHVIPLSKGGEHSYANTQLSHAVCNMRKSDKLLEAVAP